MGIEETAKEVDLMNKSFSGLTEGDEDLSTDPPVATDAPATEVSSTDAPATDAPSTTAPATDAPATDAPTTDAPDERDQTITDLRAKLAEKGQKKETTTDAPTTSAPLVLEPQDFIGDEDVENLTNNKESLNKLLNLVYSKGVTDSRNIVSNGVARVIPSIVTGQIDVVTQMKETRDNFYAANEDLKSFPNVVATVFDDIAKRDPKQTYDSIIEAVAPEVRKRLNLPEPTIESKKGKNDKGNPPKLPRKKGKSGRSQPKPKTSSVETELDAMNEVLGR
jgi:hypothetical protein